MAPKKRKAALGTETEDPLSKMMRRCIDAGESSEQLMEEPNEGSERDMLPDLSELTKVVVKAEKSIKEELEIDIPETVNVMKFAECRANEIATLMEEVKLKGNKLSLQQLPHYMRRRAASHNPSRVPRRLREKAAKEIVKAKKLKRPSRRHRRRPSNLLQDYIRRQKKHVWLETHIWFKKRFKVAEMWGYQIPLHPNDKNQRSAHKSVTQYCFLQDLSYLCCIQLDGPEKVLLSKLKRLTSTSIGLTFASKAYLHGKKEGRTFVYHPESFPFHAVGPVTFLWQPVLNATESVAVSGDDSHRKLWIWCHPTMHNELADALMSVFDIKKHDEFTASSQEGVLMHKVVKEEGAEASTTEACSSTHAVFGNARGGENVSVPSTRVTCTADEEKVLAMEEDNTAYVRKGTEEVGGDGEGVVPKVENFRETRDNDDDVMDVSQSIPASIPEPEKAIQAVEMKPETSRESCRSEITDLDVIVVVTCPELDSKSASEQTHKAASSRESDKQTAEIIQNDNDRPCVTYEQKTPVVLADQCVDNTVKIAPESTDVMMPATQEHNVGASDDAEALLGTTKQEMNTSTVNVELKDAGDADYSKTVTGDEISVKAEGNHAMNAGLGNFRELHENAQLTEVTSVVAKQESKDSNDETNHKEHDAEACSSNESSSNLKMHKAGHLDSATVQMETEHVEEAKAFSGSITPTQPKTKVKKKGKAKKKKKKQLENQASGKKLVETEVLDPKLISRIRTPETYTNEGVTITLLKDQLVRHRMIGPQSLNILLNVLKVADVSNKVTPNDKRKWWENHYTDECAFTMHSIQQKFWSTLHPCTHLPAGAVLGLTVGDPRIDLPPKKVIPSSNYEENGIDSISQRNIDLPDCLPYSPLWDLEIRKTVTATKQKESELNKLRSKFMVPGSRLELGREESIVPVILIQQPGNERGYSHGWDVIAPVGWSMAFWIAFVYNGARAYGLREQLSVANNASLPLFPFAHPDTLSGKMHEEKTRLENTAKHLRYPPNKRPSFKKLGILAPFFMPWEILVSEWEKDFLIKSSNASACYSPSATVSPLKDCSHTAEASENIRNDANQYFVLRCRAEVFRLKELCRLLRKHSLQKFSGNSKSTGAIENHFQYFDHLLQGENGKLLSALVCVNVECIKGNASVHSGIYMPKDEDLHSFRCNSRCGAPVEPVHTTVKIGKEKKSKRHKKKTGSCSTGNVKVKTETKELHEREDLHRPLVDALTLSCSRRLLGCIESGGFSFASGHGVGIGHCSLVGLLQSLKLCFDMKIQPTVLIRQQNSFQYRFASTDIVDNFS